MRVLVVVFLVLALASCKTSRLANDPRQLPEVVPEKAAPRASGAAFIANLRAIGGSSAQGAVTAADRDGALVVEINLTNVPSGTYGWMFHANGNCTSVNGFSAGPGWVPKGVKKFPADLLPEFLVNTDRGTTVTARVRDARVGGEDGLAGRSVLIYQGGGIQPIKAGVPNNAIACGVFEPARAVF